MTSCEAGNTAPKLSSQYDTAELLPPVASFPFKFPEDS